ncbi:hypothetical protein MBLNU457_g0320t1 [Dothideomycetes sp. NU457]
MPFSDKIPVFDQATFESSHNSKYSANTYRRVDSFIPSEYLATQLPEVVFSLDDHQRSHIEYDNPPPEVVQHLKPDRQVRYWRGPQEREVECLEDSDVWDDSDLEDMELFGPAAISRRRSPRYSDGKARQLLGLQKTVRKPSLRKPTQPSPPSSITHARKAIKLLGLDSPQCDRASISSNSQLTEDDGTDAVSELPGEATDTEEGFDSGGPHHYHDAVRKQYTDVFNAAQPTRSTNTNTNTRLSRTPELSAEIPLSKLLLDASQPPRLDNMHHVQPDTHTSTPHYDPQSRFSPDSDIEFRAAYQPRALRTKQPSSPGRHTRSSGGYMQKQPISQPPKNESQRHSAKNAIYRTRQYTVAAASETGVDKQLQQQRQWFGEDAYTYLHPAHRHEAGIAGGGEAVLGYAVNATPRRGRGRHVALMAPGGGSVPAMEGMRI